MDYEELQQVLWRYGGVLLNLMESPHAEKKSDKEWFEKEFEKVNRLWLEVVLRKLDEAKKKYEEKKSQDTEKK